MWFEPLNPSMPGGSHIRPTRPPSSWRHFRKEVGEATLGPRAGSAGLSGKGCGLEEEEGSDSPERGDSPGNKCPYPTLFYTLPSLSLEAQGPREADKAQSAWL